MFKNVATINLTCRDIQDIEQHCFAKRFLLFRDYNPDRRGFPFLALQIYDNRGLPYLSTL